MTSLHDEAELQFECVQQDACDAKAKEAEVKAQLDSTEQKLQAEQAVTRDLRVQLATSVQSQREKAESAAVKVQRLQEELANEQAAHEQTQMELESERVAHQQTKSDLDRAKSATETAVDAAVEELPAEVTELKNQLGNIGDLERKVQQLEEELSEAAAAHLVLERQLEDTIDAETVCHAKISRLETQLEQCQSGSLHRELQATLALLALRDKEMSELEEILQAEERIGRALEEELAKERATARDNLPKVLSQLEAAHRRLDNMDNLHSQEVASLRSQLDHAKLKTTSTAMPLHATFDQVMHQSLHQSRSWAQRR